MQRHEPSTSSAPTALPEEAYLSEALKDEHPMLTIPFEVFLDDRRLDGQALSMTEVVVRGLLDPALHGREAPAVLRFSFGNFGVTLPVDVMVVRDRRSQAGQYTLRFCDPVGEHASTLRYVINASISGDLVAIGPLLSTPPPVKPKTALPVRKPGVLPFLGRMTRTAITVGLAIALFPAAASLIESRLLVVAEARPGVVERSATVLRATASGQIAFINPEARQNEVAYTLLSTTGDMQSVVAPCSCPDRTAEVDVGATVLAGEPILRMSDPADPLVVRATISAEGLSAALGGDRIEVAHPDGTLMPMSLTDVRTDQVNDSVTRVAVPVTLSSEGPMPNVSEGMLVRIQTRHEIALLDQAKERLSALTQTVSSAVGTIWADARGLFARARVSQLETPASDASPVN